MCLFLFYRNFKDSISAFEIDVYCLVFGVHLAIYTAVKSYRLLALTINTCIKENPKIIEKQMCMHDPHKATKLLIVHLLLSLVRHGFFFFNFIQKCTRIMNENCKCSVNVRVFIGFVFFMYETRYRIINFFYTCHSNYLIKQAEIMIDLLKGRNNNAINCFENTLPHTCRQYNYFPWKMIRLSRK